MSIAKCHTDEIAIQIKCQLYLQMEFNLSAEAQSQTNQLIMHVF